MNRSLRLILFIFPLTFITCKKDQAGKGGIYNGPDVKMGYGTIRSYIDVDHLMVPKSIGFVLNTAALEGLPDINHVDPSTMSAEYILEIPAEASRTPFKHMVINWDPQGHQPPPYSFPHFDCHFYMVSNEEREMILPYNLDAARFNKNPAAEYLPINYIKAPGGEPRMGAHWVDSKSPELQQPPDYKPFTETFVYGTFNGSVNFMEPMITYNFLYNATTFVRSIPRPAKVERTGYYPNTMRITRSGVEYKVSLEDMEYREAQ
jgi:hypothetical protein